MSDDGNDYGLPPDASEYVEVSTFEQILEMDDGDPTLEFSRGLVMGFFEQADTTFDQMKSSIETNELAQLSSLGHFLKGSSATLGIYKLRDSCEKIQHLGALKSADGQEDISEEEALGAIKSILPTMLRDYESAKKWLEEYFGPEPEEE